MFRRVVFASLVVGLSMGANAFAQSTSVDPAQSPRVDADQTTAAQPPPPGQPPSTPTPPPETTTIRPSEDTRPATTTWFGDTGLWFVPTGEVLGPRKWSFSGYRANFDREQGFTDISHFIGTFGVGVGERAEIFGSLRFDTRIDRDIRPLFNGTDAGGVYNDYPFVRDAWTGDQLGDFIIGAKFNILSEYRQNPAALAVRAALKLPTGDEDKGVSTGKVDFGIDLVVSKEVNQRVEISGFGGYVKRGDPDEFALSDSFRWGIGAGFPTRKALRLTTELHGQRFFDDVVTASCGPSSLCTATDLTVVPTVSPQRNDADFTIGLTWQAPKGFFVGAGISRAIDVDSRSKFGSSLYEDETGDKNGFQFRIGYHPGVRVYAPPPPPPPPPPPVAPENRPPTVRAQCDPCTVVVCEKSTVTATGQDPDGDALTYRWTAPTGTFANPSDRQTVWTAPCEPGSVPVTVTVDDGHGHTASDTVTIQVVRPAVTNYVFEDVHFDFDRYTLRPEATRVLDEAVRAMRDNASLRIQIEGHTCNIGTAEYNLALGDRRARAVRDYLVSQGITADRLSTVSYGEERPKHDNAREETRRLNRRAALTVRLTQD
jgi:outer membrane protein OmpA-like peptidoglycan-associated protein